MNIAKWLTRQNIMGQFYVATDYERFWWGHEEQWTKEHATGFVFNIGGGISPITCDVSSDPLEPRDLKCVGESLPLKAESVDTVLAYSVLDHCLSDNKFLSECCRVLKVNGKLLIMQTVWGWREIIWGFRCLFNGKGYDKNHMRHYYSVWHLKSKIERFGFRVTNIHKEQNCYFICAERISQRSGVD